MKCRHFVILLIFLCVCQQRLELNIFSYLAWLFYMHAWVQLWAHNRISRDLFPHSHFLLLLAIPSFSPHGWSCLFIERKARPSKLILYIKAEPVVSFLLPPWCPLSELHWSKNKKAGKAPEGILLSLPTRDPPWGEKPNRDGRERKRVRDGVKSEQVCWRCCAQLIQGRLLCVRARAGSGVLLGPGARSVETTQHSLLPYQLMKLQWCKRDPQWACPRAPAPESILNQMFPL